MSEQDQRHNGIEAPLHCAVCIVGAGLAGLNALFVASQYLTQGQRVVLIDRRARVGGMWVDTYPYVRLHQPHPLFTAGNIAWELDKPRSYLATQTEVLEHFQRCLDRLADRVEVVQLWGHTYDRHQETDDTVKIACTSADASQFTIVAERLIKAPSADVPRMPPLTLSSEHVHSVSPNDCDVRTEHLGSSNDPVWIVGGGKTAMDTARALLATQAGRQVNMIAGDGTVFYRRERCFPTGVRRWLGGTAWDRVNARTARRFDGTNETQTLAWFANTYGIAVTDTFSNFFLGVLSRAEARIISEGLTEVVMDYLDDVIDVGNEVHLRLRSGATRPIPAGSWLINCTGYLSQRVPDYEPYTSASGRVLSLNGASVVTHIPAYKAYFLTHLMFLNKLTATPLYEIDASAIRQISRPAFALALLTVTAYNLSILAEAIPHKAWQQAMIDLDHWYPAPRQALIRLMFRLTDHRARRQYKRTLDTLRDRFDIRCGPITDHTSQHKPTNHRTAK